MDQQKPGFSPAPGAAASRPTAEIAVVAVAAGNGLGELFRESGCAVVVDGGQTMNPSVAQILEGARQARAEHVIVLPNNKNIVAAAQQAAANDPSLHVVSSTTVPQGVAAILAYNPEQPLEDNLRSMEERAVYGGQRIGYPGRTRRRHRRHICRNRRVHQPIWKENWPRPQSRLKRHCAPRWH